MSLDLALGDITRISGVRGVVPAARHLVAQLRKVR